MGESGNRLRRLTADTLKIAKQHPTPLVHVVAALEYVNRGLADQARIEAAQANAKISEDQISKHTEGQDGSDAQAQDLNAAIVALELAAVDAFTLFEARMQHHFKRGPFSRKLRASLLGAGRTDLADRIHKYYLVF